jgi:type I restriction enzyme, S subunit
MAKKGFKDTEIGMIPGDWDIISLKESCPKIGSGITPRGGDKVYKTEGIALIRSQNVHNNRFIREGLVCIDEYTAREMDNVEVVEKDILLNITGDSVARCCTVPNDVLPARVNQHVSIIRTNGKYINPIFLRYYLTSPKMQNVMLSLAQSGGTRNALTKGMIEKFAVPKPAMEEQESIARILSDLDAKIELNQQTNKTLEKIGQALFKQWFIDFEFPNEKGKPYRSTGGEMVDSGLGEIPEGWEAGRLGDICDITMGQSPPGSTYNESGDGMCFYQGITDFGFRFPSKRVFCTAPTRFAEEGDVLLSVRAPVGALNVAEERCAVGRGVASVRLKGKHNGFLYYLLLATKSGWETFEAEGTVFGAATKSDVHDFKIIIPPKSLIQKFASIIEPKDVAIRNSEKESRTLTGLRDSLLPRLMSGKIRVAITKTEQRVA